MDIEELNNEETAHEISELFAKKEFHKIKNILIEINPTDIAAIFDELPKEQMLLLFRLLPKEEAAETFVELDGDMQEALISLKRLSTSFTLMIPLILSRKCLRRLLKEFLKIQIRKLVNP